MLKLFDCNNTVRVRFEADTTGLPLRGLFLEAFSSGPNVYFFDGKGSKALRREIYPEYKGKRKAAPDNFYLLLNFYKELLLHTNNVIVEVPGYEADDVIATFCKANPTTEIEIDSTDRDFCGLLREGLTTPKANLKGVPAEEVRLYKTLVGDTSDNIPGIVGFAGGAWEKLTPWNKELFTQFFEGKISLQELPEMGLHTPKHQKADFKLLQIYWDIVGFYGVPNELIQKHTRVGTKNYALADSKLKESLQ